MEDDFFDQLHKLSREDEMRSQLLIRGAKQILEKKKEASLIKKLFRKKKKPIVPKSWK